MPRPLCHSHNAKWARQASPLRSKHPPRVNFAEAIYHHFYLRRKRAAQSRRVVLNGARIISVGNLTTGGTGKTPTVQWLARRFEIAGISTAIVARGYGGEYSSRGAIVSDGKTVLLNATQAGDEAVLHARALPSTPVIIGRDRVAAAKIAIGKFAPKVILLDDGFQFWSLARDFDLVLLDARKPFGNGKLLPIGRLREPKSELKRAAGVLLTRADKASESQLQSAESEIRQFTNAPIFRSSHAPVFLREEKTGARIEFAELNQKRVAVFSALANNQDFFESIEARGASMVSTLARSDHHAWRENEIRNFAREAQAKGAQVLITTEKDAVKLNSDWSELPIWSSVIELKIENENDFWALIFEL